MENDIRGDVLVVPSPSLLTGTSHVTEIETLCVKYRLVIFLFFGDDQYDLPTDYIAPANAHIIEYSYETIDDALLQIQELLTAYDIELISRHDVGTRMPFLFGGAVVQVPSHVNFSFFTKSTPEELSKHFLVAAEESWDLLN